MNLMVGLSAPKRGQLTKEAPFGASFPRSPYPRLPDLRALHLAEHGGRPNIAVHS